MQLNYNLMKRRLERELHEGLYDANTQLGESDYLLGARHLFRDGAMPLLAGPTMTTRVQEPATWSWQKC